MQPETALLFWSLMILNKRRYDALKEHCGSLDRALERLSPEVLRGIGMREDAIRKTFVRIEEFEPEREIGRLQTAGVELVSIEDDAYPSLLRETADPPVFLSYRGDLSIVRHPCVSLVGTRDMTAYGERLAEWITPAMVRAGCTTVSGLAFGIDAVVAQTTMDHDGRTAAVLGSGLGAVSPKTNVRLADAIVRNGGCVLSEYPFGEVAQPYMFPARNRIIAGLGLATVVIEAPSESGALITARLALEENRDVLACPGPLFDPALEGCNRLIAEGQAQLLRTPDDILRAIGVVAPAQTAAPSFVPSEQERALYDALTTLPQSIDELVEATCKTPAELGAELTLLELAGGAAKAGGGWVRL